MLLIVAAMVVLYLFLNNQEDDLISRRPHDLREYRMLVEDRVLQWRQQLNGTQVTGMRQDQSQQTTLELTLSERGYVMQEVLQEMMSQDNMTFREIMDKRDTEDVFREALGDLCEPIMTCSVEVTSSSYRTYDGSCNNLKNARWGTSHRRQRRTVPQTYADDFGAPRLASVSGDRLSSPRVVSNVVHRPQTDRPVDSNTTVMVMAFGQFFSHDLSLTPVMKSKSPGGIECCNLNHNPLKTGPFGACLPIELPADDSYFRSTCMTFVRTAPATCDGCKPCRREQLNDMTSYIDASQVYGASTEHAYKLRSFVNGSLVVVMNQMLPGGADSSCVRTNKTQRCFLAGDSRVNVVPNLSSLHTMFVRYHNLIAEYLSETNPSWNDEKLFHEARKIVVAIMQNIVFSEYLPVIVDESTMNKFGLKVKDKGHDIIYDDTIDATISNSFSTAAFRFGHTTIPDVQVSLSENYSVETVNRIEATYNNPNMSYFYCDGLARWLANERGIKPDGNFGDGTRNLLFKERTVSFDLIARNIQRGRDHGLPTYNQWRAFCNLDVITEADFRLTGSRMADFSVETSNNLRKVYSHPDDIDLYAGGLKEEPLPGAQIGPLFSCVIGMEFYRLKYGDRFYFENPSPANGPNTGFTEGQLQAIKKMRLSKIVCDTMKAPHIQKNVFRPPSNDNPVVMCNSIDDLDFSLWKQT